MLPIGTPAPDFTLPCVHGPTFSLNQYQNKGHVVLAFLPSVATQVNREQMQLYQELIHLLPDFQAKLMGLCIDPVCLGDEFIRKLSYPILADDSPVGEVGQQYQVFDKARQQINRTVVVVDMQGKVVLYHRAEEEEIIGADIIFTTLAKLTPHQ